MLRGATVAGRSPDRWEASVATLADWVRAGRLRYEEEILEGLESSPDALAGLYRVDGQWASQLMTIVVLASTFGRVGRVCS
jgi:NADPH-dependent curcumin reductase CurA